MRRNLRRNPIDLVAENRANRALLANLVRRGRPLPNIIERIHNPFFFDSLEAFRDEDTFNEMLIASRFILDPNNGGARPTLHDNVFTIQLVKEYRLRNIQDIEQMKWVFPYFTSLILRQYFIQARNPQLLRRVQGGCELRVCFYENENLQENQAWRARYSRSLFFQVPGRLDIAFQYSWEFYRILYQNITNFIEAKESLFHHVQQQNGHLFMFMVEIYFPPENQAGRIPLFGIFRDVRWMNTQFFTDHGIQFFQQEDGLCFIHAFQRAQRRKWMIENQKVIDIEEYFLPIYDAKEIHTYVETKTGIVDLPYDSIQHYAEVFKTNIHIYKLGNEGRQQTYRPSQISSIHIYMIISVCHVDAVTNIRKFLGLQDGSIVGVCDMCGKTSSQNRIRCLKHLTHCLDNPRGFSKRIQQFVKKTTYEKISYLRPYFIEKEYCRYCQFEPCIHPKTMVSCEECRICHGVVARGQMLEHTCYMPLPKLPIPLESNQLWVVDIESRQVLHQTNVYIHECILICVRNMYNPDQKFHFDNENGFLQFLKTYTFPTKVTWLAHNGGKYDYPFFLREFEKNGYRVQIVPSPNSFHRYLSMKVSIHKTTFTFIDFMRLVPGSLRGIAKAFQLPLQKGDFPHNFFTYHPLDYVGPFPTLQDEHDFFCLRNKRSQEDIDEVKEWILTEIEPIYCTCWNQVCSCQKPKWKAYDFLLDYCWKDVDVLAEACQAYRNLLLQLGETTTMNYDWQAPSIDPFHCMTQSQIAVQVFLQGCSSIHEKIYCYRPTPKIPWQWSLLLQSIPNCYHPGNSDLWWKIKVGDSYWAIHGVVNDGGPTHDIVICCQNPSHNIDNANEQNMNDEDNDACNNPDISLPTKHSEDNEWKPYDQKSWEDLERLFLAEKAAGVGGVVQKYNLRRVLLEEENFDRSRKPLGELFSDREIFYGGRTDVFSGYADAEKIGMDIHYLDVCSLYPYVCSFSDLPIGRPTFLLHPNIEPTRLHPTHPQRYEGYAKIKVVPCPQDYMGLLPEHDEEGRLVFSLHEKIGFWHTEEIYLALSRGYRIIQIYQVIHFDASQRSTTCFRGYMEHFLRMKQESEGWKKLGASSHDPSESEKDEIIENLYISNGNMARLRKEMVSFRPVMRQISKIFLNCLWGKFCQRQTREEEIEITNILDFREIMDGGLDKNKMVVRQVQEGKYKVRVEKNDFSILPNGRYNIFIAAAVTSHARCILHRQMIRVGPERILYCDTDSLVFLHENGKQFVGQGLGQWTDEYPTQKIVRFYAVAPKAYMIELDNHDEIIKSKGCILTMENKEKMTSQSFRQLLTNLWYQKQRPGIQLYNMVICPNTTNEEIGYARMLTRHGEKEFRAVITKRDFGEIPPGIQEEDLFETCQRIMLFPKGYRN